MKLVGCVPVGVDGNTAASLEGDPILAQLIEPPRLYNNRAGPILPVLPKAFRKISFRQILMITAVLTKEIFYIVFHKYLLRWVFFSTVGYYC